VKRSKNRSDVTRFWGSGDSTSKRILDVLESFYNVQLTTVDPIIWVKGRITGGGFFTGDVTLTSWEHCSWLS